MKIALITGITGQDGAYLSKYIASMYLMMQHDKPDDYIIASGKSLSIREIIYYVFDKLDGVKRKDSDQ